MTSSTLSNMSSLLPCVNDLIYSFQYVFAVAVCQWPHLLFAICLRCCRVSMISRTLSNMSSLPEIIERSNMELLLCKSDVCTYILIRVTVQIPCVYTHTYWNKLIPLYKSYNNNTHERVLVLRSIDRKTWYVRVEQIKRFPMILLTPNICWVFGGQEYDKRILFRVF